MLKIYANPGKGNRSGLRESGNVNGFRVNTTPSAVRQRANAVGASRTRNARRNRGQ